MNTAFLHSQQGFDFFHWKIKAWKIVIPSQKCLHLNVRILGAYEVTEFAKFPVWISKDEAPWVSNWAKFAVKISKDEALTPLLTKGFLFISMHLSCVHLATLKIHSVSQTPPNFEQRTSLKVVNNSGNEATSLAVRKKCGRWWAVWGQVG